MATLDDACLMDLDFEEQLPTEDDLPYVPMAEIPPEHIHRPLLNALRYVVLEARKHALEGNDDHFVEVGRVCQSALVWWNYDQKKDFDKAATWLARIPFVL